MIGQITPMFLISLIVAVSALIMLIGFSEYAASFLSDISSGIAASSSVMRSTISQGMQTPDSYGVWVEWQ